MGMKVITGVVLLVVLVVGICDARPHAKALPRGPALAFKRLLSKLNHHGKQGRPAEGGNGQGSGVPQQLNPTGEFGGQNIPQQLNPTGEFGGQGGPGGYDSELFESYDSGELFESSPSSIESDDASYDEFDEKAMNLLTLMKMLKAGGRVGRPGAQDGYGPHGQVVFG